MVSAEKAAERRFRGELGELKSRAGWTNRDVADALGCSEPTVVAMMKEPGKVTGRYILIIQELLRRDKAKYGAY